MSEPEIMFVCVQNSGRSQIAAALAERLGGGMVLARSAGTRPADQVNPTVVQVMREVGVDLSARRPTRLQDEQVREADVVVTMGCGDECPYYPGKRYEDWDLPDIGGKPLEEVRGIRDEIEGRVRDLLDTLR
jgi:arsenate reductase